MSDMLDCTLRKNFFFTKEIQCVASYLEILIDIVIKRVLENIAVSLIFFIVDIDKVAGRLKCIK